MNTNLKKLRENKNFTRQRLACNLHVSEQYYGKIEKTNAFSIKKLKEICLALGYTKKEIVQIVLKELDLCVVITLILLNIVI